MTRYGFVSTFPPTRCGVASFTAALVEAISAHPDDEAVIVRVDDGAPAGPSMPGVRQRIACVLRPDDPERRHRAAVELNDCDAVIVQHQFGIYGGPDGDEIIDLIDRIEPPVIVVMHTVLAEPTLHQRAVTKAIAERADVVVAMTRPAAQLLRNQYGVELSRLRVIPRGVDDWVLASRSAPIPDHRPTVLTWGLLAPDKGIECGIQAIAELDRRGVATAYRVLGATHPKIVVNDGQRYRRSLQALARELGVDELVEIDGRYQDQDELAEAVAAADIVLLAYDSRERTTSAVLLEALAAGRPVIATRFPHAVELLSRGGGLLVDDADPGQVADAIESLLSDPARRAKRRARTPAAAIGWTAVAEQYKALAAALALPVTAVS